MRRVVIRDAVFFLAYDQGRVYVLFSATDDKHDTLYVSGGDKLSGFKKLTDEQCELLVLNAIVNRFVVDWTKEQTLF